LHNKYSITIFAHNLIARIIVNEIDWELRAKNRRIENKALKKRIKELTISRDSWKAKFMEQKDVLTESQIKLETGKKNIQKVLKV